LPDIVIDLHIDTTEFQAALDRVAKAFAQAAPAHARFAEVAREASTSAENLRRQVRTGHLRGI
jgi:hypothetical protein